MSFRPSLHAAEICAQFNESGSSFISFSNPTFPPKPIFILSRRRRGKRRTRWMGDEENEEEEGEWRGRRTSSYCPPEP
jgi:hypothetical protein